jgi:hypothetical protein
VCDKPFINYVVNVTILRIKEGDRVPVYWGHHFKHPTIEPRFLKGICFFFFFFLGICFLRKVLGHVLPSISLLGDIGIGEYQTS